MIVNKGVATKLTRPGEMKSVPDVICLDNIITKLEWQVSEEQGNSDHLPIVIHARVIPEEKENERYNLWKCNVRKSDWKLSDKIIGTI